MSLIDKFKRWWKNMLDYNKIVNDFGLDMQTGEDLLKAIELWSQIFNGHEPWINDTTASLHIAKTMCEKVSKAVTIEFKSEVSDPYINEIYQRMLGNKRKITEFMLGKSCVFLKPYYNNGNIDISIIQADKFIPVSFNDSGDLISCIVIDQIVKEKDVYTRLEYSELSDNIMTTRNIAYKGRIDGVVLSSKIPLNSVDKWKDIQEVSSIDGVDRLIGGFATTNTVNNIDNNSPIGVPIYYNAIDTLKEIDKQYSRTLWEYEGTELAIDVDESVLDMTKKGYNKMPNRFKRLFRKLSFDDAKNSGYNVFSPEIRDTSLFNGLNEYLRQAENECGLAYGTISKPEAIEKTATEIKASKQDYYITVSDIQASLQKAFDDLIYGIYVLCKLYGIPVGANYTVEYDWDDSILVDKESTRNQALIEKNNKITSDVQYIIETRNMKEDEAIEFVMKQKEFRKLTENDIEEEPGNE